jgi:hypothetical protein
MNADPSNWMPTGLLIPKDKPGPMSPPVVKKHKESASLAVVSQKATINNKEAKIAQIMKKDSEPNVTFAVDPSVFSSAQGATTVDIDQNYQKS